MFSISHAFTRGFATANFQVNALTKDLLSIKLSAQFKYTKKDIHHIAFLKEKFMLETSLQLRNTTIQGLTRNQEILTQSILDGVNKG